MRRPKLARPSARAPARATARAGPAPGQPQTGLPKECHPPKKAPDWAPAFLAAIIQGLRVQGYLYT
jgi:hypothetical protein